MANPNYVLLERISVGEAGASSVTFNNIPQSGYTDLKIVASTRTTYSGVGDGLILTINGSTSSVVTTKTLSGNGASASSYGSPSTTDVYVGDTDGASATANTFGSTEIYIPNYLSTTAKSISADHTNENNATTAYAQLTAGLWNVTGSGSIINKIKLSTLNVTNFVQYSTFSLYGLAAVGTTPVVAPYASGGDIIQTDGTYWYHAFLSSGTFTPAKALSCDYLVVAGGGGGTYAGGGAGGLRSTVTATGGAGTLDSALSLLSNTGYTVTIGAGGAGSSTTSGNGANSSIIGGAISITSLGGGGSTVGTYTNGNVGGSGGGGGGAAGTGGAGTANQGFAGGNGASGASAGGGGAGVAGSAATTNNGGAGGNGIYTAITDAFGTLTGLGQLSGGHYYFAGGGGGSGSSSNGTGGLGGGGVAGLLGVLGTPNTGGGGGGGTSGTGRNGGSGIVIVRYAI